METNNTLKVEAISVSCGIKLFNSSIIFDCVEKYFHLKLKKKMIASAKYNLPIFVYLIDKFVLSPWQLTNAGRFCH